MQAPTRRVAAGVVFVLAVLATTPLSSSAAPVSGATAHFAVSISGKFTSSGTATNRFCWDAAENPIVAQRAAETTWTFASTKAGRAEFVYLGGDLGAGMTKLMSVAATGVRTASESPKCAPQFTDDQPVGSSCGTKHANYLMSIYASSKPARVGYSINENPSHLTWPDDPWVAVDKWCPPLALVWTKLNVYTARPTAVSQAKIFNRRVRRIVANGKRTGGETNPDASSNWSLEYTITLTRRR